MAFYQVVKKQNDNSDLNRRSFLRNTSFATMVAMMGGVELRAEDAGKTAATAPLKDTEIPVGPPVKYGVIGLGARGRHALVQLAVLPNAPVVAICDHYAPSLARAGKTDAPKAARFEDYQQLLAAKDVQAVVIATPTHTHREIVLAALKAGKHVYCEAPLANTIDDARAIAAAARDAVKLVFQAGLQERSHPQRSYLMPFIRTGSLGDMVMVRAQSHQNNSWVSESPNADRVKELNWRLDAGISLGLMGEIGLHQIDAVSWFLGKKPLAVTGFGSVMHWKDGRTVPDTVQGVFEYPADVNFMYDATLCNSFDKDYEMFYGNQSALMMRDAKAWLFYEPGAELGGWEVYSRKDDFYKETGIAVVANATKQKAIGTSATADAYPYPPMYYALQAFTENAGQRDGEVKSFIATYGDDDAAALAESIKSVKPHFHAATWQDGLDATIVAIKANEAVLKKQRIPIEKELFVL